MRLNADSHSQRHQRPVGQASQIRPYPRDQASRRHGAWRTVVTEREECRKSQSGPVLGTNKALADSRVSKAIDHTEPAQALLEVPI